MYDDLRAVTEYFGEEVRKGGWGRGGGGRSCDSLLPMWLRLSTSWLGCLP